MFHYYASRCTDTLILTIKVSQLNHARNPISFKSRWAIRLLTYPQKKLFGRKCLRVISNTCCYQSPRKFSINWKNFTLKCLKTSTLMSIYTNFFKDFMCSQSFSTLCSLLWLIQTHLYKHFISTCFCLFRVSAFPTPSTKTWNTPDAPDHFLQEHSFPNNSNSEMALTFPLGTSPCPHLLCD